MPPSPFNASSLLFFPAMSDVDRTDTFSDGDTDGGQLPDDVGWLLRARDAEQKVIDLEQEVSNLRRQLDENQRLQLNLMNERDDAESRCRDAVGVARDLREELALRFTGPHAVEDELRKEKGELEGKLDAALGTVRLLEETIRLLQDDLANVHCGSSTREGPVQQDTRGNANTLEASCCGLSQGDGRDREAEPLGGRISDCVEGWEKQCPDAVLTDSDVNRDCRGGVWVRTQQRSRSSLETRREAGEAREVWGVDVENEETPLGIEGLGHGEYAGCKENTPPNGVLAGDNSCCAISAQTGGAIEFVGLQDHNKTNASSPPNAKHVSEVELQLEKYKKRLRSARRGDGLFGDLRVTAEVEAQVLGLRAAELRDLQEKYSALKGENQKLKNLMSIVHQHLEEAFMVGNG